MPDPWSNENLNAMRQIGDPDIDLMAERIIARTPFNPQSGSQTSPLRGTFMAWTVRRQ